MKTTIYKNYSDFLDRADKEQSGVSEAFAKDNPAFEKSNITNKACWNCRGCSDCSYCSDCSGCSYCSDCSDCSYCSDCRGCSDCSYCSDCSGCSYCRGCSYCSDCSDCSYCSYCSYCSGCRGKKEPKEKSWFDVPVIEGIHQKLLAAVKAPDALDMSTWHKCDTTHCRGGWVVTLAGDKGRKLEAASSTLFAAMQIYKASSAIRVSPVRFFETDKVAMADMERCAKLEADAK